VAAADWRKHEGALERSETTPNRYQRQSVMPRYDDMQWSQRVREQPADYSSPAAVVSPASQPSRRRTANPRIERPKPPRDEDAELNRTGMVGERVL
jgi:hypothetical protein